MKTKKIFGYVNTCFYTQNPHGETRWFDTETERELALSDIRTRAREAGVTGVKSSIYRVEKATLSEYESECLPLEQVDVVTTAAGNRYFVLQ